MLNRFLCSRRHWLQGSWLGLSSLAAAWLLKHDQLLGDEATPVLRPELVPTSFDLIPKPAPRPPRATAMISMTMIGGPSQIDLFDPKPELARRSGEAFPGDIQFDNAAQASRELMGAAWRFHAHGECGMELSELLPCLSEIVDDICLIRSMHTGVNNHVPSLYALNTGLGVPGRASLGSWLTQALGSEAQDLPAFVALTDPRGLPLLGGECWHHGALPALYQGTVVRPQEPRMFNLQPPARLAGAPQRAQLDFLQEFNAAHRDQHPGESELSARMASYQLAARMQLAAQDAFDLSQESAATLAMYGVDQPVTRDYGTRCLIARRLVERGVRFVQIFNNGQSWDHHGSILTELPNRCREIDRPAAALVRDLKQRGLLDTTLVHWGGEMGRLPVIQLREGPERAKIGRDHNTFGFSMWAAGGGLRGGYVHGRTDDFSHHAVEDIVHHYDWLATVLHLFGLDAQQLKFRAGTREVKLVQNAEAQVVHRLLA